MGVEGSSLSGLTPVTGGNCVLLFVARGPGPQFLPTLPTPSSRNPREGFTGRSPDISYQQYTLEGWTEKHGFSCCTLNMFPNFTRNQAAPEGGGLAASPPSQGEPRSGDMWPLKPAGSQREQLGCGLA